MALAQERTYTIDDIYALPDGQRAELIDGRMYMMAPPSTSHQKISWKLHLEIGNYISSKGGKYDVYAAPFSVYLNNDSLNYVEPDISVICDRGKIDEKGCKGAPDWIIEIVSPSSQQNGLWDQAVQVPYCRRPGILDRKPFKADCHCL